VDSRFWVLNFFLLGFAKDYEIQQEDAFSVRGVLVDRRGFHEKPLTACATL
jgi:hypothetical protein